MATDLIDLIAELVELEDEIMHNEDVDQNAASARLNWLEQQLDSLGA